ncbi:MAG: ABC transporter ATP-binding protein [Clostridiaceae bacterium]|nr:ABC transporter ATP-binding protein [Clostridiaceae bacterium]
MMILKTDKVGKKYLNKWALSNVDISLEQGKIIGLLGPNGSGKTTFLKLVIGMIRPSSGSVTVCGMEIGYKAKEMISFLPDSEFLYNWMTIREAGDTYAAFFKDFDMARFNELLQFMALTPDMKFKGLSKGMKEKLAIALTLSRNARLIVLDEPLNGVDPVAREQILGAIVKSFSHESTILVTSHLINEVENILDEAYFLKEGKIVLHGSTDDLRSERNKSLDELYREVFAC